MAHSREGTAMPKARRRGFVALAVVVVLVAASSAWVWYQAQGLEEKVLSAIQPHLLTDVQVGGVEMTLWSCWPNVEVVLRDVRIEDAIIRGTDCVELKSLGIVFGWLPLLQGRFEAERIQLSGGRIRLNRTRDGRENWKFWRSASSQGTSGFSIAEVRVEDVAVEGEWWASGAQDPIAWKVFCDELEGTTDNPDAPLEGIAGTADLREADVSASGEQWLSGVDLGADFNVFSEGENVAFQLNNGRGGKGAEAVPFTAWISSEGGFAMALRFVDARSRGLLALVPGMWRDRADEVSLDGALDLDVIVGKAATGRTWSGPADAGWSGEWAVRVVPNDVQLDWTSLHAQDVGGEVQVYPDARGWQCRIDRIAGRAVGGEFAGSGQWRHEGSSDALDVDLEFVGRPSEAIAMSGMDWSDLGRVDEGGTLRGKGALKLTRNRGGDWAWASGAVEFGLTDLRGALNTSKDPFVFHVAKASASGQGQRWKVTLDDVTAPGISGAAELVGTMDGTRCDIDLDLSVLDVDLLHPLTQGSAETGQTRSMDWLPNVDWVAHLRRFNWDKVSAQSVEAQGSVNPLTKEVRVASLSADVFGGRMAGGGVLDERGLEFEGRLAEVEIAELLEGTSGLGQSTLLPGHVQGQVWAEGTLSYAFDQPENLAWETDLDIRIEGGQLVDFDLLQRIPETLKEAGKYRMLADADDLSRRLRRVKFEPMESHISLERGLISLDQMAVVSDAMDVGIAGWQRLSGGMDYTLDFAIRDLKSGRDEFGTTADDGLGHRFFLAIGGTLEAPEFGYDKRAHQSHRKDERRAAFGRLKELVIGAEEPDRVQDTTAVEITSETEGNPSLLPRIQDTLMQKVDDDDDDFRR